MNEFFVGVGILVAFSCLCILVITRSLSKRKADEVIRGNMDIVGRIDKSIRLVVTLGVLLTLLACTCMFLVFTVE